MRAAAAAPPNGGGNYLIPGAEALELRQLSRALAFLGEEVAAPADPKSAPVRCGKDTWEETPFERWRDLFTEVDLVFFDATLP